jgi:hypothetical protein
MQGGWRRRAAPLIALAVAALLITAVVLAGVESRALSVAAEADAVLGAAAAALRRAGADVEAGTGAAASSLNGSTARAECRCPPLGPSAASLSASSGTSSSGPPSSPPSSSPSCGRTGLVGAAFAELLKELPAELVALSTARQLRRTVRSLGELSVLEPAARRLAAGQCLRTVLIGGSISTWWEDKDGSGSVNRSGPGGEPGSFRILLFRALDRAFPRADGRSHGECSINLSEPGTTSNVALSKLQVTRVNETDLFIVEKGINDFSSGHTASGVLERAHMHEALLRFLRHNYPTAAVLYLEVSWRFMVPFRGSKPEPPFHRSAAADHAVVAEWYGMPHIDMVRLMQPLSPERRAVIAQLYFSTGMPLSDDHHLRRAGHVLVAAAMLQFWVDLVADLASEAPWLAPPAGALSSETLTAQEAPADTPLAAVDLRDRLAVARSVVLQRGWTFASDVKGKPAALITLNASDAAACARISLGSHLVVARLELTMLASYEHFGDARVELSQRCGLSDGAETLSALQGLARWTVSCHWDDETSQAQVFKLPVDAAAKAAASAAAAEAAAARSQEPSCEKTVSICGRQHQAPNRTKLKAFALVAY